MTKYTLLIAFFILLRSLLFAQTNQEVVIPTFADKYSQTVKQLEAGVTDINYKEFRESFIQSEQFKVASAKSTEFSNLKKEMRLQIKEKKYNGLVVTTKKMLSIDYTSMIAHKILRQTYKILDDSINSAKYKAIQFGLLTSITKSGDGKTCATGWPVIQIDEEYFILEMLGANLLSQGLDNSGGICDRMEVKTEEGENKTYYFEVSQVFEGYKKLGMK
jgi:Domain of unknown function (DUF4919)